MRGIKEITYWEKLPILLLIVNQIKGSHRNRDSPDIYRLPRLFINVQKMQIFEIMAQHFQGK